MANNTVNTNWAHKKRRPDSITIAIARLIALSGSRTSVRERYQILPTMRAETMKFKLNDMANDDILIGTSAAGA